MHITDLSGIAYFAPSLPRLEVDEEQFWIWWNSNNIPITKELGVKDGRGNVGKYNGALWDGITIWQKPDYQKTIVWKVNYCPNDELFSQLVKDVITALPWYDVQGLTLWSNKSSIPMHQDGIPRDPFPSAPRIALFDNCKNRTFFIFEKTKFKKIFPDFTSGPNLFFFNNETCFHGATEPIDGRKILIRIDGPLVDSEGFKEYISTQINNGAKHEGSAKFNTDNTDKQESLLKFQAQDPRK